MTGQDAGPGPKRLGGTVVGRQILALGEVVESRRIRGQIGWAQPRRVGLSGSQQNPADQRPKRVLGAGPLVTQPHRLNDQPVDGLDETRANTAGHPQGGGRGQIRPVQSQTVMQRQINQIEPALEADPLRAAALRGSDPYRQRFGEPVLQDRPARRERSSAGGLLLPPHRGNRHIRQVGGEHLLVDVTNIRTRRRRFSQAHASAPCSPSAARYSLTTRGSDTRV